MAAQVVMSKLSPFHDDLFRVDLMSDDFSNLVRSTPATTLSTIRTLLMDASWVKTAVVDPRAAWERVLSVAARVVEVLPEPGFEIVDQVASRKPYVAAAVLSGVSGPDATLRLARLLDHEDADVRLISAEALATRPDAPAREALRGHARDRSSRVRDVVRAALQSPRVTSILE